MVRHPQEWISRSHGAKLAAFNELYVRFYLSKALITDLMTARPILRSSPCLVVGMPVARATLLLRTSIPNARLIEIDDPGIPAIFMVLGFSNTKVTRYRAPYVRDDLEGYGFPENAQATPRAGLFPTVSDAKSVSHRETRFHHEKKVESLARQFSAGSRDRSARKGPGLVRPPFLLEAERGYLRVVTGIGQETLLGVPAYSSVPLIPVLQHDELVPEDVVR